ncbi:MAG: NAD-dependent epimerase/dehydratase family protein [Candidatus Micrarchaeaceae archaeon]
MLISGGNGFLGSYLVEKALSEGYTVTVIDDMSTMKEKNISENVKFIKKRIEDFYTNEKFDYYIHLAARPSPDDYVKHPVETSLSNSVGTQKMLEMTKKNHGIFFYTSSSETYGEAEIIPTPETYWGRVNFTGIRACYDESKRFSEALALSYFREYNLDVRIERPFNVFGPKIRIDNEYGRVIPRFISQALKNKDITIYGDGLQTRSFLYIDDWVDATWKFIKANNLAGEIINIGSNIEITIKTLAEKIKALTNSSSKIIYLDPRQDDPTRRAADTTKAKKLLNWEIKTSLDEGLIKTIEWIKGRIL